MENRVITHKEVTRLFALYSRRPAVIEKRLDDMSSNMASKNDIQRIMNALDALLKKADIDDSERLALSAQLDRHEKWIQAWIRKRKTS